MNIAFFGTSDKSLPILNSLKTNFDLRLCITKTNSLVGRKKEKRVPLVKRWADKNNIDCLQISNFKEENLSTVKGSLISKSIELGIMADFSIFVPIEIISTLRFGLINIHFSILPKYRGASPVQHTILNNEKETGITFYLTDEGMDTGDIIYIEKHKLKGNETTKSLYEELFLKASLVLPEVIEGYLNKKLIPYKQNHTIATYCYSKTHPNKTYIYKEDAKLNWKDDFKKIYAMIRAFYDWPIAYTTFKDINSANLYIDENLNLNKENKGTKFKLKYNNDKKIKVYSAELSKNFLKINEIQVEGKNIMKFKDFINGYLRLIN